MSAYGGDKDDGVVWVAKRASCGEVVCCRPCGCGYTYSVCLDGGEVLVVPEQFNGRHGAIRASIQDHLVKNVVCCLGPVRAVVVLLLADELFYEILDAVLV